jgi:hypothetical protein
MRPQKSLEGCVFEEDGNPCGENLILRSWLYCKDHKESGPKQAKKRKTKEHVRRYRAKPDYRLKNSRYQFFRRHRLTEPKLRPLFEHIENPQEEYTHRDDFSQAAWNEHDDIMGRLLNPPAKLLSVAKAAQKQTKHLHNKLQRQQEVSPNRQTALLIGHVEDLQRDCGRRISASAFRDISRKAKDVLEMWRAQREIFGFILALLVYRVELNRLKFMVMPHQRGFLERAHRWLPAIAHVCALAGKHCADTHKQTASFLAFCVPWLEVTLAFNSGEPEQAESILQSLDALSNDVAASYGTTPATKTIRFSYLIRQAEFYMRVNKGNKGNKIDRAYRFLHDAEEIFDNLQPPTIELQFEIAYVKATLGLASNDEDRHKDLEDYILLFKDHPFLSQHKHLRELKRVYKKDVDESLFEGIPIYFDTMFRRLHPFLVRV